MQKEKHASSIFIKIKNTIYENINYCIYSKEADVPKAFAMSVSITYSNNPLQKL